MSHLCQHSHVQLFHICPSAWQRVAKQVPVDAQRVLHFVRIHHNIRVLN